MTKLEQNISQKYQEKEILILGFGREGKSTLQLLQKIFADKKIDIMDQENGTVPYSENLQKYQVIFKTPGISHRDPQIEEFVSGGGVLSSQLNEFLEVYKAQTIGVTGTKGKSTTSSLIHHILQTAEVPTVLAGNIGTPVFECINQISEETKVVIEMSSYQLETVTHSPHIAVFLNIFPEHLNYHQSFENYVKAKSHITTFQTAADIFIYNEDVPEIAAIARQTRAQKKSFSTKNSFRSEILPPQLAIFSQLSEIVKTHNVPPAVLAAEICCVKKDQVERALHSFQPLEHRLQNVGTFKEVTFIDDTLATIPEATAAALDVMENISVLILGGFDRGIDFTYIVDKFIEKKIPNILFFKPSGEKMYTIMKLKYPAETWPQTFFVESMEEAVKKSYELALPGSKVLLSPASPSYGQFKNYEDKSQQFVHWIKHFSQ